MTTRSSSAHRPTWPAHPRRSRPSSTAPLDDRQIGPKHFTDLLTLVHVDGRWQIIAKVFHFELDTTRG
jgi:hypothetical protein